MLNSSVEEIEVRSNHTELLKTGLWKAGADGQIEAVHYPKANFVTAPTSEGIDLRLLAVDKPDLSKMKINFKGSSGREEMFPDYVIKPHLYVPGLELWLTDGHRYLPTILQTAIEMGKPTQRVISVDLDYFGRIPEKKFKDEAVKLLGTAVEATNTGAVVIPDAHEDDFEGRFTNRDDMTLSRIVEMTNNGQIQDENFIPALGRDIVIIKPPLSEYMLTVRQKPGVRVILPNGSMRLKSLPKFDLVHMCTSPGYMQPQKAIAAMRVVAEELYGHSVFERI